MTGRAGVWLGRTARHLPTFGLSALCALTCALAWNAAVGPLEPQSVARPDVERTHPNPLRLAESESPDRPPFQAEALIKKPLFSPTRTQPQPPPPAPPPPEPFVAPPVVEPPPSYTVRGIVATPSTRKVLLRKDDQSKPIWLAEGRQSAEGWLLSSVTAETITLAKGSRTLSLRLQPKPSTRPQVAIR